MPLREVQQLTGYIRGDVTALACKRDYPVYANETIQLFDVISVSAGVRGTQILLSPADYLRITYGSVAPIAKRNALVTMPTVGHLTIHSAEIILVRSLDGRHALAL